jgi:hypothetical protein
MALTDGMAFAKLLDPERVGEQDMESVLSLFFEQVVRPRD